MKDGDDLEIGAAGVEVGGLPSGLQIKNLVSAVRILIGEEEMYKVLQLYIYFVDPGPYNERKLFGSRDQ